MYTPNKHYVGAIAIEIEPICATDEENAPQVANGLIRQASGNYSALDGELEHAHLVVGARRANDVRPKRSPKVKIAGYCLGCPQKVARLRRCVPAALTQAEKMHPLCQVSPALHDADVEFWRNM